MEHESFESPEVAELLNRDYVAIKVDREELPDVDHFYMEALHAFHPRGGWPLNMFVTPDLKPFFGGTYFPKDAFLQVLGRIQETWRTQPELIREQAERVANHVQGGSVFDLEVAPSSLERLREKRRGWLQALAQQMRQSFDPVWGGFGSAPKFPRSHATSALLRSGDEAAVRAAAHSLKAMAYGGMRDHLGGGFHRYSTDERWLVPHFEKMLYDQALLVKTYSEAYARLGEPFFADIVEETLDYLEAEMRLPSGGFAAAQDADSEGVEGKFFVWTREEIAQGLQGEPAPLVEKFLALHSVTRDGNWAPASGPEGRGAHARHVPAGPVSVLAAPLDASWEDLRDPELRRLRKKLFAIRSKRIAPVRDDKALVSWNAWMASGLLEASTNLAGLPALSERLLKAGRRTLAFLDRPGERVPHVFYGDEPRGEGYLEDLAAVAHAWQMLGVRTGDPAAWAKSCALLDLMDRRFRDPRGRLGSRAVDLKDPLPSSALADNDNATPAAISQAVGAGLRQALVDSDLARLERALKDLAPVEAALDSFPGALPYLLCELDLLEGYCLKTADPGEGLSRMAADGRLATGLALFADEKAKKPLACDFDSCRPL
jgi:uncharacterized protein YyaL (SSP411 family)